jgi:predicted dithiol-disulfide oxidoreductase (DUF899 family)
VVSEQQIDGPKLCPPRLACLRAVGRGAWRTFSRHARDENLLSPYYYQLLDQVPKGRGDEYPARRHDEYPHS